MFYSTIMKIDSIDRLRDIRDALLVEQGINPTRQGEQAIKVVVERIDEIVIEIHYIIVKTKIRLNLIRKNIELPMLLL